jgi:hypothetical protein
MLSYGDIGLWHNILDFASYHGFDPHMLLFYISLRNMVVTFIFVHFHDPFFVQWNFKGKCHNPSFVLVTKVKGLQGCKVAG